MSEIATEKISIIIPTYNEVTYIDKCLKSIFAQTISQENVEIIVVDGGSTDGTKSIVSKYKNVILLDNPKKLVTYALNIGIENSSGDYIIRMDAHSNYEQDYIEKCIYYLKETGADNVGGVAKTVGIGFCGQGNAEILSSKFGVGNSKFRTENFNGYVDTVPFGAFRREVFEQVGLFNPELPRSEDNDINSRIRKNGGKVYLSSDIKFEYYCRNTVGGLLKQAILNGNALFLTLRKNPKAMSVRHFIPFLFVLSLLLMPVLCSISNIFCYLYGLEAVLYLLLDIIFSFFKGERKTGLYKFVMFPLFHFTYGIGSFLGLFGIKLY